MSRCEHGMVFGRKSQDCGAGRANQRSENLGEKGEFHVRVRLLDDLARMGSSQENKYIGLLTTLIVGLM